MLSSYEEKFVFWLWPMAPNFDRVFVKNLYFLRIVLRTGNPNLKILTSYVKSGAKNFQNDNFDLASQNFTKISFLRVSKLPAKTPVWILSYQFLISDTGSDVKARDV